MAVTKYDYGTYYPIRSGQACPVCGSKKGRCSQFVRNEDNEVIHYRCKYAPSDQPSNGWYIHKVDNLSKTQRERKILPTVNVGEEMTEERKFVTDEAYRYFRELVKKYEGNYLNKRDYFNLRKRGLQNEQILRMNFFSMPTNEITSQKELDAFLENKPSRLYVNEKKYRGKPIKVMVRNYNDGKNVFDCQLNTAISKDMEEKFGEDLLKVAGFIKLSDNWGNDYITFKGTRYNPASKEKPNQPKYVPIKGFFIPYTDPDERIVGLQYRLTVPVYDEDGKKMRYFWYSSKNARSGSPIDYYKPSKFYTDSNGNVRNDIILATEGGLKGKIASEKLGFKTVAEAGVSNYRNLVETINEISNLNDEIQHKVILALDLDKEENVEVKKAEEKTIKLLVKAGYEVAVATWDVDQAKGIDDALQLGLKIDYSLI
jgi:hypothetical protein